MWEWSVETWQKALSTGSSMGASMSSATEVIAQKVEITSSQLKGNVGK